MAGGSFIGMNWGALPPASNGTSSAAADPHSIYAAVGSTKTAQVRCAADVSGRELEIAFESRDGTHDIAMIADGDINKDGSPSVSFVLPPETTTVERTLRGSVRDVSNSEVLAGFNLFVTYQAIGD